MRALAIFALLGLAGCGCNADTETGCGIAGASFDAKRVREEAQNYKSAHTSQVDVRKSPNSCLGWKEGTSAEGVMRFDDLLRRFSAGVVLKDNAPQPLGMTGLNAAFVYTRNNSEEFSTFRLGNAAGVLVEERFPQAFNHPLLVGMTSMAGRDVIVVTSRSRSTTGMRFLAMYSTTGELLYRDVYPSGLIWDMDIDKDSVVLIGCGESRFLSFRNGANNSLQRP